MKFLISLIFFLSISFLFAQEQISLQGVISDKDTKEAIEFANVYIPETKYYSTTDINGKYTILIPALKKVLIKISRLGYDAQSIILENPKAGSTIIKNVELIAIKSQEVTVTGEKYDDHLIREKAKDFALLPTVSHNIESILPSIALGVRSSAGGELSSQYSVRGGSYDENLLYVNDFEIYRPQLIRNGQQEGLSFPNPNLIRELSFSSGGFEAKYGDKQSSVLDIRYKVPYERKYSIEGSLLGASIHAEGVAKLSKRVERNLRYLVGLRYKSNQYLLNSQDIEGEYVPKFYDIQTHLSYDLNKNWQISFLGNLNLSKFSLIPQTSAQARGSLLFGIISLNTYYEGKEVDYFNTSMIGLSCLYFPKERKNNFFVKFQSSLQGSIEAEQFDILGYYRLVELEISDKDEEGREIKLWGEGTQHRYGRNYLQTAIAINEVRTGIELGNRSGVHHLIQAGIGLKNEKFIDRLNEWERIDSAGYSLPYKSGDSILLNQVYKSKNNFANSKISLWIQDAISLNSNGLWNFHFVPGVRFNYNELNQEFFLNPRLRLEANPKNSTHNMRTWLSMGTYYQPPFYRELRSLDGNLNYNLQSQKNFHIVAGLKKDFHWRKTSASKFHWISEIYYKKGWEQVSYDLDNVRIRYSGENDSESYAIGWDNRINAEFVPGAESWINLSLLRARESFKNVQHLIDRRPDGTATKVSDVPRPTDQLFALSMFFQDYLPNNENFKTHVQTTIASGIPYGVAGNNIVYRNEYRFKTYHRVDIGFSYKLWDQSRKEKQPNHFLKFCRNSWISLEVFNMLQVKNPASVRWIKSIYNYEFAIPTYLSSRRINLRFRIEF